MPTLLHKNTIKIERFWQNLLILLECETNAKHSVMGLKCWRQEVAIFRQTAENFWQQNLVLKKYQGL